MSSIESRMIKKSLKKLVQSSLVPHLDIPKLRFDDFQKPGPSTKRYCHSDEVIIHGVNCHWLTPKKVKSEKIILYFHGGAYVCGPSLLQWRMLAKVAHDSHCMAIMVNYRIAPEYPFPAGMDDMMDVYTDLLSYTETENIIFMGDSAGGGLALAMAMKLRDSERRLPSKLILLSPWLDVTMENPKLPEVEELDQMLALPGLIEAGEHYAGDTDRKESYISPLFGNLEGLPPSLLMIGTHDVLLCDCRILKEKSEETGYDLSYEEWDEMFHVWMLNVPYLREARAAVKRITEYINS